MVVVCCVQKWRGVVELRDLENEDHNEQKEKERKKVRKEMQREDKTKGLLLKVTEREGLIGET